MEQVEFNVVAGTEPLIEEKYGHPVDLLDALLTYYPNYAEEIKVNDFHYVGKGSDAYVFNRGDRVYKFTQSEAHAQVANEQRTCEASLTHLVKVYDVKHLPHLGVYLIQEEYLFEPPENLVTDLSLYFREELDKVSEGTVHQLELMMSELDFLGVSGWEYDCFAEHNILYDPKLERLKLFDFGYTECEYCTKIEAIV